MSTIPRYRTPARRGLSTWLADAIVAVLVMSWWKRICYAAVLVGTASLGAHLFGAVSTRFGNSWGRLPIALSDRAPLFVRSWLANDSGGMMQFVRPADGAKLQSWVVANPIPAELSALGPSRCAIQVVSAMKDDTDGAAVKIRIADAAAPAGRTAKPGGLVLRLAWLYTGGQWMFSPDGSQPAKTQQPTSQLPAPIRLHALPEANSESPDMPEASDTHRSAAPAISGNVVIPSTVPPWQRAR